MTELFYRRTVEWNKPGPAVQEVPAGFTLEQVQDLQAQLALRDELLRELLTEARQVYGNGHTTSNGQKWTVPLAIVRRLESAARRIDHILEGEGK